MKKILLVSLLLLLMCSVVRAEAIPNTYNYDKASFQWMTSVYNNTSKVICSNTVVTLDMSVASNAVGFAAYASQKMASAYIAILGVADENIATKSIGRVCVRGPHLVRVNDNSATNKDSANIATAARYPRVGDPVVNSGVLGTAYHAAGTKFSDLGSVNRASKAAVAASGLGGFVGYRIGQTTSQGTLQPASSAADDLIYIWVQPSIGLTGQVATN